MSSAAFPIPLLSGFQWQRNARARYRHLFTAHDASERRYNGSTRGSSRVYSAIERTYKIRRANPLRNKLNARAVRLLSAIKTVTLSARPTFPFR
jgi:hypothetical protein